MEFLHREKGGPPLYLQLAGILRERVESGEYAYGDTFPSEKQLQAQYGVSRVTVRQAVAALVQTGHLHASQGMGTRVVFRKLEEPFHGVVSFSKEMAARGVRMETSHCAIRMTPAPRTVAGRLQLPPAAPVYQLTRVRCADGVPIVYSVTYLKDRFELPLDPAPYRDSLYRFLREDYGVCITHGQDTFEAVLANEVVGAWLQIPVSAPVFKRVRCTQDETGAPFEYTLCYYPGDKYQYSVEL